MKLRILNVVGARPNFMKMAPLLRAYRQHPEAFAPLLVHTGQHYDENMSQQFLDELQLPAPDINLGVGPGNHAEQTVRIMAELGKVLAAECPGLVVVVGDVNSTMAAAVMAAKHGIPVAHVEAGLRSGDLTMPEEINRIVTDAVSDYCFTPSADADENLRREGVPSDRIILAGNVMIDSLRHLLPAAQRRGNRPAGRYGFVTLHRPRNVDDRDTLAGILLALERIELPLVFPVHPRTAARLKEFGLAPKLNLTGPLGYLDSINLLAGATLVITDSGGVQEETTALGVPCLTLRDSTERPVTVTAGTNTLVGADAGKLLRAVGKILAGKDKTGHVPPLWDGHAAERIVQWLQEHPPKR